MFLLPIIQDIEVWKDENSNNVYENVTNVSTRKLTLYDYIYLMSGNELLKFKIELDHIDIVNVLEKYIDSQSAFDNVIMSEKELKGTKIPLKFLYPLGYYRLENNLFKTKNYLVPKQTDFLEIITEKYWDGIVDTTDLYNLNCIMTDAVCDEDDNTIKLIYDLFERADVELVERFEINEEQLINTINNIKTLLNNSIKYQDILVNLKWILDKSKSNKEYMYKLGLRDKFNKAIEKEKVKVK